MKNLKSILLFAIAFFCSFFVNPCFASAQNAVDTVGGSLVYTNTQLGVVRILPKSSVLVQINTVQNSVGLYTVANQSVYVGRLSALSVPNAATNEEKILFLKKNVGSGSGGVVCCNSNSPTNTSYKIFRGYFFQDQDDAPLQIVVQENTTGFILNSVWEHEGLYRLEPNGTIDPSKLYISNGIVDGGRHGYLPIDLTNDFRKSSIGNYKVNFSSDDNTFRIGVFDDSGNFLDFWNFNPDPSIPTRFPFEFYIYN